jgi:hypothetical protein
MIVLPTDVVLAAARCEDAIAELNVACPEDTDYEHKCEVARFVRQHIVCIMSSLEQTGIDAALSSALEAYDRKLEQEGIEL